MKTLLFLSMLPLLAGAAQAQSTLLTASPIPDDAERRFCYYAGLAYSVDSYILIGGTQVTQVTGSTAALSAEGGGTLQGGGQVRRSDEQKPLRCVVGDDGILGWSSVATLQLGK